MVGFGGLMTFGVKLAMASSHYKLLTSYLGINGCQRVDVVFDRYMDLSIKADERCN